MHLASTGVKVAVGTLDGKDVFDGGELQGSVGVIEETGNDELFFAGEQLVRLSIIAPVYALRIFIVLLMDIKELALGSGVESLVESIVRNQFSRPQGCVDVGKDVCLFFGEVGIIPFKDNIIELSC